MSLEILLLNSSATPDHESFSLGSSEHIIRLSLSRHLCVSVKHMMSWFSDAQKSFFTLLNPWQFHVLIVRQAELRKKFEWSVLLDMFSKPVRPGAIVGASPRESEWHWMLYVILIVPRPEGEGNIPSVYLHTEPVSGKSHLNKLIRQGLWCNTGGH